jgi:hypothetical protein
MLPDAGFGAFQDRHSADKSLFLFGEPGWDRTNDLLIQSHFPCEHRRATTLWVTLKALSTESDSPSVRLSIEWNGQWRNDKAGITSACPVTVDPAI